MTYSYRGFLLLLVWLVGCGSPPPEPIPPVEPEISYSTYSATYNLEVERLEVYLTKVRASELMTVTIVADCQFSNLNASATFEGELGQTTQEVITLVSGASAEPPDTDNEYTCMFTATDLAGQTVTMKGAQ
jgi:hypothetical protein